MVAVTSTTNSSISGRHEKTFGGCCTCEWRPIKINYGVDNHLDIYFKISDILLFEYSKSCKMHLLGYKNDFSLFSKLWLIKTILFIHFLIRLNVNLIVNNVSILFIQILLSIKKLESDFPRFKKSKNQDVASMCIFAIVWPLNMLNTYIDFKTNDLYLIDTDQYILCSGLL